MESIALCHYMKIDNKASKKQIPVHCLLYMVEFHLSFALFLKCFIWSLRSSIKGLGILYYKIFIIMFSTT